MDTESTYLTVEEVANLLHLKKATIWGMCRTGKLPALKLPGGKNWLIDHRELAALQKRQRKTYGNA